MVDVLATKHPKLFGETVAREVGRAVDDGRMVYPNIRFAGSGEVIDAYLPALGEVLSKGIHLWGFSRNIRLAKRLRDMGAAVIISCDHTSPPGFIEEARNADFHLAYSSLGVTDSPPEGTIVTFPVHRIGRVREVVDTPTLCPKVLSDFFDDSRPAGSCQDLCRRCHLGGAPR
jgi:hypothetical protein